MGRVNPAAAAKFEDPGMGRYQFQEAGEFLSDFVRTVTNIRAGLACIEIERLLIESGHRVGTGTSPE